MSRCPNPHCLYAGSTDPYLCTQCGDYLYGHAVNIAVGHVEFDDKSRQWVIGFAVSQPDDLWQLPVIAPDKLNSFAELCRQFNAAFDSSLVTERHDPTRDHPECRWKLALHEITIPRKEV